jgi:putative DNA-invertase from lambdoid prophage Rac
VFAAKNGGDVGGSKIKFKLSPIAGGALVALLSSLAKVEAQKISERTRAGMSRAKAKGVKIGRPKLAAELRREITSRGAKGETA